MPRKLLLGLFLSIVAAAPAHGATWGVSNTADTPIGQACAGFTNCSLREAVTSTELNGGPDAILVSGGTYALTNGQLTITDDLQVARVGASAATISGNNASRIFDVTGGDFVLRFLTLTDGRVAGQNGGAIRGAAGTTIAVESATISSSDAVGTTAAAGGAIFSLGAVTIGVASGSTTGSAITGNSATASSAGSQVLGGGVAVSGAALTIGARTTITGNDAVAANTASDAFGGGVYADNGATINATTISGNDAQGGRAVGGGVAGSTGTITLTRSTVSGNSALSTANSVTGGGGGVGIVASGSGNVSSTMSTIANNTISTNTAGGGTTVFGGGIANLRAGGAIALTNSTLAGNAATTTGPSAARAGGVHTASGTATVGASILAENTQASSTSQCAGGALTSNGYSLLGDISACTYTPGTSDVTGVTDAGIEALANNGGLTQTMALLIGSGLDRVPALNALCSTDATDQRGISRPQAGACDTGAYEARPATLTVAPDPRSTPTVAFSGTSSASITVSNAGDLATPAAVGFSIAAPFGVTGCASPVAGASNCTATVTVTPTALGSASQTLTATSGSLSDTATVNGFVFGNTAAPTLSGATGPLVGGSLGVTDGTWNITPSSYAREWQRCDADGVSNCTTIGGATGTSYGLAAGDVGRTVRARVSATASSVTGDPAATAPSGVVGFANTAAPALTGGSAPRPGDTLGVTDGTWSVTPDGIARQWQRCDADGASNCAAIPGAAGSSYVTAGDDAGHRLRVRVVATASGVSAAPAFTDVSALVAAAPPAPAPPSGGGQSPTDVFGIPLTPDCELAGPVMLDVRRAGKRVRLGGLGPLKAAGQRVTIKASRGGSRVTTRVLRDGSFSAILKAPRGKNAGAIRYTATLGGVTSAGLRLDRRFILLSKRPTPAGVLLKARVVGGRPGLRVTLRRALPCTGREERRTLKLGRGGVMSVMLPRPTAEEKLAFYRVYTDLPKFPVWTLPIVVRAVG